MIFNITTTGAQPSVAVSDPGSRWQYPGWHAYYSGTAGGGSFALQYSPDSTNIPDASSRWFAPTALTVTTFPADVYFTARFRKMRVNVTGGSGINAVVELV